MAHFRSIQDAIASGYSDLSVQLKKAADHVAANPMDVASRSLRAVSLNSELPPATYSRLARALGFESYEDMRELCRKDVGKRVESFSEKAEKLGQGDSSALSIIARQMGACIANIEALQHQVDPERVDAAAKRLAQSRSVVLFGAYGSTGIVEYMAYLAHYCRTNWVLAGRMGASLGAALAELGSQDTLLVVTKAPYTKRAIVASQMAQDQGASSIVITDDVSSPALKYADFPFIIPSESPQFFSSYTATLAFMETLMALLVSRDPQASSQRIRQVEQRNSDLGEFWSA